MIPKIHVILISGKMGSGKDTLALNLLQIAHRYKGWRAETLKFASPIYEIHNFARGLMASLGQVAPENLKIKDGPLLQFLGTEWGRSTYGEDVWTKALQSRMFNFWNRMGESFPNYLFLVTDCRFKNEFHAFDNGPYWVTKVRLECDRDTRKTRAEQWRDNENHQSEIDLDKYSEEGRFHMVLDSGVLDSQGIAELVFHEVLNK
jgi:hypothetical protein